MNHIGGMIHFRAIKLNVQNLTLKTDKRAEQNGGEYIFSHTSETKKKFPSLSYVFRLTRRVHSLNSYMIRMMF